MSANAGANASAGAGAGAEENAGAGAGSSAVNVPMSDPAYKKVYEMLQQNLGRVELGDDPKKLEAINEFLQTFPYRNKGKNGPMDEPWVNMSVKQLFQGMIQTAIDIINDLSYNISQRNLISSVDFRRNMFEAFTHAERRTYVGLWLILFSFVLYFIDSAT